MSELKEIGNNKCFGGFQKIFSHYSKELSCDMNFAIYLPPQTGEVKFPVIYYLSGLTCNETNCVQKAGFQRIASKLGVIVVCPDTSPRNIDGLETGEFSWDFGYGAGFYVDATTDSFKKNFRMYSYITKELIDIIDSNFPVEADKRSIFGHSMGGHGALICALKNPGLYKSVSAFAPISNPINCPWGKKAFSGYLGSDESSWKEYDATELISNTTSFDWKILIDQGSEDQFLKDQQLLPENFVDAATKKGIEVEYRLFEGYDHSYFFISSFIADHLEFHTKYLKPE